MLCRLLDACPVCRAIESARPYWIVLLSQTSSFVIAVISIFSIVGLSAFAASDEKKPPQIPVAEVDGIQLFLRLPDLIDADHPVVICDFLNTTDKPVSFAFRGAHEGYSLMPHLFDASGKELPRTKEWTYRYDTGDSLHSRYAALRPGITIGPIPLDLKLAYGENWSKGETLTIEWDSMPKEKKPGPHGGDFGVGHGVAGSIDISPFFKNRIRKKKPSEVHVPAPEAANSAVLPVPPTTTGEEIQTSHPLPHPNQASASSPLLKRVVLIACILLLLVGLFFWIRAKRKTP